MKKMTIQEAIRKKVPSMAHDFHRDAQIIDALCEKCGSPIACVYDDLGALDYYDNFAHFCLNVACDFVLHQEEHTTNIGGPAYWKAEWNVCPFCKRPLKLTF